MKSTTIIIQLPDGTFKSNGNLSTSKVVTVFCAAPKGLTASTIKKITKGREIIEEEVFEIFSRKGRISTLKRIQYDFHLN